MKNLSKYLNNNLNNKKKYGFYQMEKPYFVIVTQIIFKMQ